MFKKKFATKKYTADNKVELIRGGKAYFDLILELINNAICSIHLQTYIFCDDETGTAIADALILAAKKNVQVYLLVDGYASQDLSKKFITNLVDHSIHFRFFEPFFNTKHFYFGRRLHHKVFVADAKYAIVGGVNIANKYNDKPMHPAWLDFAILVEGVIVDDLFNLCKKTWTGFIFKSNNVFCNNRNLSFLFNSTENCDVRMRRNDWVKGKNEISSTYKEMLSNAKSHITIICSYFLPGKIIRKLLDQATKRGVKVTVITAGPSDVMLAKYAERWMYDWLLRNGISLYEYQSTVLHAKVAICDNEWLTIGSYNINNISAYASIELNLDVRNEVFASYVEKNIIEIIQQECIPVTKTIHMQNNNLLKQLVRWCSYQFIRIAFYLITFYYKRKKYA